MALRLLLLLICVSAAADAPLTDLKTVDFSIASKPRDLPCFLRKETAEALSRAQTELKLRELRLRVLRCYAPGDPVYGRGGSVDALVTDVSGRPVELPRGFPKEDVFRAKGWNKKEFRQLMQRAGFQPRKDAWWKFDLKGWSRFPVEKTPVAVLLK